MAAERALLEDVRAALAAVDHDDLIVETTVTLSDGRAFAVRRDRIEEVASEWKRDFIRNAAHQLRTPLAAIASSIAVLEAGGKDDPEVLDRFLRHVRTHSERLTRLTRGLLVLARADSGETPRLQPVQLSDVLGAEIPIDGEPTLAALADPDLLHEALAALVENAVKHGAVSVDVREVDGEVVIRVADNGPGVAPELRSRIFDPFFRADAEGEGFGLGLSIAARSVEAMGGELLVEPDGPGGRFTIRLPSATMSA